MACALERERVTARSEPLALPLFEVGDRGGMELEARLAVLLDG